MASVDRLAELQALSNATNSEKSIKLSKQDRRSSDYSKPYESIEKSMAIVNAACHEIEHMQQQNKKLVREKDRTALMLRLQKLTETCDKVLKQMKYELDAIAMDNEKLNHNKKGTSSTEIRSNLYQSHLRKFAMLTQHYNQAKTNFKNHLQTREKKMLEIICPQLTTQQIDRAVEAGQAQEIMKQAITTDGLQDTVRLIEERHMDILHLEQSILEIASLFRDLSTLVDLQQESLDVIENHIVKAKLNTEKGLVNIQEAKENQDKARKRRCCLLFILLGILIAILSPIILKIKGLW